MGVKSSSTRRAHGDGSIYQNKKGKWVASLDVGIGIDGKRKRSQKVCSTYQEAKQALRVMQSKKLDHKLKSNERQTLHDLFDMWREFGINEGIRETTKQDYLYLARRYVLPSLGHVRLAELDTQRIDQWLVNMQRQGMSAITRKKARQVAGAICKFGVKRRCISVNPVTDSLMPRKESTYVSQVQPALNLSEWTEYLRVFRETELDCFVHIAALLGLRRGEIIGLNWSDIDFEERFLEVKHSARELTKRRNDGSSYTTLELNDPKTQHSRRKLEMSEEIVLALRRQQLRQKKARLKAGVSWVDTDAVFTTSVGTRLYPSNVFKKYERIIKKTGLRYVRIHDLRHTVAKLALEAEVPLESVSRLLGHSSLSITMDIYAQNVQSVTDRAARGIAELYQGEKTRNRIIKKSL